MKWTVLLGGLAVVGAGGLALAMMLPPTRGMSQDAAEFAVFDPPPMDDGMAPTDTAEQVRAELHELRVCLRESERKAAEDGSKSAEGERKVLLEMQGCLRASERLSADLDLLERQAELRETERKTEDNYLSTKLGPDVDASGVERVPGADKNQPYRTCEKTPEMRTNIRSPGDTGHRAYRDIDSYLSVTNVIETQDCTCAAKIIPHAAIAVFEDRLRDKFGVTALEPDHTRDLYNEYERQKKIVAAMCGEY